MRLRSEWLKTARCVGTILLLAGIYYGAAKLGLTLATVHPSATPVWAPTGIALASVLLLGYSVWPGLFLGAFLANLTTFGTLWTSFGIATGNTLEGVVGAYLVNRYANGIRAFDRPKDIFQFALLSAVMSTTISASIGVASLTLGGFAPLAAYWPIWFTWWLGDAAGALIVAPLIVLWSTSPPPPWSGPGAFERILFLLLLLEIGWVVFAGVFPFAYFTVPFLVWAAFRFDQRETATVITLIAALAILGTVHHVGPFVAATPNASLLVLQAFMGIMVLVALPLGSVVAERETAIEEIRDLSVRVQEHNAVLERRVRERTQELDDTHLEMLERLAAAAEFRDDATGQHIRRVGQMSVLLARHLGLSKGEVELIARAAPLHDVGKIGIPDRILLKPDTLTAEEFEVIKTHTTIGARILAGGKFALLRMAEEIALTHHERWDGSGYPYGLKGETIPISGRIVALVDTFDALTNPRSYRKAKSVEEAITVITCGAGTQFDPRVVDAFLLHTPEPWDARTNHQISTNRPSRGNGQRSYG